MLWEGCCLVQGLCVHLLFKMLYTPVPEIFEVGSCPVLEERLGVVLKVGVEGTQLLWKRSSHFPHTAAISLVVCDGP